MEPRRRDVKRGLEEFVKEGKLYCFEPTSTTWDPVTEAERAVVATDVCLEEAAPSDVPPNKDAAREEFCEASEDSLERDEAGEEGVESSRLLDDESV